MVKAVIGEENRLKIAEDRLSRSGLTSQVGLVIGKLSFVLDRGFVFDLVPTPPNDVGEPACSLIGTTRDDNKKGAKKSADSSALVIDTDWLAEHARQVSRMLVGGIKVIGIFVWVSDAAFKNSTITLCQTVKEVAVAANVSEKEQVLIHISLSPRRWTCRNCSITSNITSSSLRPCEFKMGRVLASMQTFKCIHNFNARFPIHPESTNKPLVEITRHNISLYNEDLKNAKAIIDGNLVNSDALCATDCLHEVEILLPFMQDSSAEACSRKDVVGVLVFSGSVCSYAYLNVKEPISQAVTYLKDDIIRSLQSRLEVICDEACDDQPSADDDIRDTSKEKPVSQVSLNMLRKGRTLPFPRRVFVPWLENTFICDYLHPSDTLEVLKGHCVELLSMETPVDVSGMLEPEVDGTLLAAKSFWDVTIPFSSSYSSSLTTKTENTTMKETHKRATTLTNVNAIAAIFFLLLSVVLGFMLSRRYY